MGLFDKVKNLFTEEDEPVKSEVIQVEIPAPVKEEKKVVEEEPKPPKLEKQTPIFFDDEYFKELEQPKKEIKSSYLKEQPKILKEEKRVFKPTPIISPVYGVLDKNYIKEDIKQKKENPKHYTNTTITIDEVRKKAYGTLEDELENTLNDLMLTEEKEEADLFDELIDKEEPIDIIDEEIQSNMVGENLDKKPVTESELFDLIDSMYEKGE